MLYHIKMAFLKTVLLDVINPIFDAYPDCDLSVISEFPSPGPRLFLSCPIDVDGSRVWFTDLWNYSIIPYLLEAVREGLQVSRQKGKITGLEWHLFKR